MKVISALTDRLIKRGQIPEEDRDIYIYGFDIILYTIWSTAVLLIIGFISGQFWAGLIIVAGFYTLQSSGGGYHANSHIKCLLTMIAGLLVGLSFYFIKEINILLWVLLDSGVITLLLIPLVLHPNKLYLETKRRRLTIRSIVVTLSILICTLIINVFWNKMLYAFAALFLLAGISRIAGRIKYSQKGKTFAIREKSS